MLLANDVASVIIARTGRWLDAWSLQKLLYYVQAWHVAVTGEPLFNERVKAWRDGPVVPAVWRARRDQGTRRVAAQDVGDVELDSIASDLIDLVVGTYGSMSGEELSALTHVEAPWKQARGDLPEDADCQNPISLESMATFYRGHRKLGGRSAADLAACGIHLRSGEQAGPVDVDAILASMDDDYSEPGEDRWGGANLQDSRQYDAEGIEHEPRRAYAGA